MAFINRHKAWLIPCLLFTIFAFFSYDLDLWVSRQFFDGTHFWSNDFLTAVFDYGPVPGYILVAVAIIGFFLPRYQRYKKSFLYIFATLAIGSLLIVHLALKETWGRPRPVKVIEFGGKQTFKPFYEPAANPVGEGKNRSFPSGHVTMGGFFFCLYFLAKKKRYKFFALATTFLLSFTLAFTRIAQGGHFLSDTVASFLIMWLTAYSLTILLDYERSYAKTS